MKKQIILAAVSAVMAATSQAQIVFNGSSGDSWFTGASWDGGALPTSADDVWLNTGGSPTVDGAGAVGNTVTVGLFGFTGNLTVDAGADLTTAGAIVIANDVADTGSVVNNGLINVGTSTYLHAGTAGFVNNGTLNTADLILGNVASGVSTFTNTGDITTTGWLYLSLAGSGTFNMNGGTVNTATFKMDQAGTGHLQLDGGTIIAGGLGLDGSANNTIDITGGTMLVNGGDRSGDLAFVASLGYITAYGGAGTVVTEYDAGLNQTKMYATIPEPATLGLFALVGGGTLWVRKKFMI